MKWHKTIRTARSVPCSEGMSSRTSCRTHRSRSARLTTRGPRASRLSRSRSRTSSCATFNSLRCLGSPTFFSYEPRTARRSCSCSLERAGSSITDPRYHGMLAPSRQRDKLQINTSGGLLPMRAILRRASRCRRPKRRLLGAKTPPSASFERGSGMA